MDNRAEFLSKLSQLVEVAKTKENLISVDEVKEYFIDKELTEEQMELVFDYLLSQKVVVKGYLKIDSEEKEEVTYTEEEKAYLEEYSKNLETFSREKEGEKENLFVKVIQGDGQAKNRLTELYLQEVVEIAKEMYHPELFLGDMIQEGNVGLIVGMDMLTDLESAHKVLVDRIKQSMQAFIEEHTELCKKDHNMIEKVSALDEGIKTLTEELGRKVTIDELAVYMGMSEEEIGDILRLMGEETEEESE